MLDISFSSNLVFNSAEFVEQMADYSLTIRQASREITLKEVDERRLLV